MKAARSGIVEAGGLALRVLEWGEPSAPPVVLVHGWGDAAASFAPLAERLAGRWRVIAPDLRGFGESARAPGGYWFPDYLVDLEAVIATRAGGSCALVGHSMGGNVAGLYAGVRPERVQALALLEGFGLPPAPAGDAPARYRRWLEQRAEGPALRDFPDRATLLAHLRGLAPRATPGILERVADAWAVPVEPPAWRLRMDPRHKAVNPVLYRRDEAVACWAATTAPVLLVSGEDSDPARRFGGRDPMFETAQHYRRVEQRRLAEAGHMMHWEQPAALAALLEAFLDATAG